jgi:hypothetical protein
MPMETKFLQLRTPVELGSRFGRMGGSQTLIFLAFRPRQRD